MNDESMVQQEGIVLLNILDNSYSTWDLAKYTQKEVTKLWMSPQKCDPGFPLFGEHGTLYIEKVFVLYCFDRTNNHFDSYLIDVVTILKTSPCVLIHPSLSCLETPIALPVPVKVLYGSGISQYLAQPFVPMKSYFLKLHGFGLCNSARKPIPKISQLVLYGSWCMTHPECHFC